jgi:hypothetical protein
MFSEVARSIEAVREGTRFAVLDAAMFSEVARSIEAVREGIRFAVLDAAMFSEVARSIEAVREGTRFAVLDAAIFSEIARSIEAVREGTRFAVFLDGSASTLSSEFKDSRLRLLPISWCLLLFSRASFVELSSWAFATRCCRTFNATHPRKRSTATTPPMMAPKLAMPAPPPLPLLPPMSRASAAAAAVPVREPTPVVVGVAPSTGETVGVPTGLEVGTEDGRLTRSAVVTLPATEVVSTSALARELAWLTNAAEVNVVATEVARSE